MDRQRQGDERAVATLGMENIGACIGNGKKRERIEITRSSLGLERKGRVTVSRKREVQQNENSCNQMLHTRYVRNVKGRETIKRNGKTNRQRPRGNLKRSV